MKFCSECWLSTWTASVAVLLLQLSPSLSSCNDTNAVLHYFESLGLTSHDSDICTVQNNSPLVKGTFSFNLFCKETECNTDKLVELKKVIALSHDKHILAFGSSEYDTFEKCYFGGQKILLSFGALDAATSHLINNSFKFNLQKLYQNYINPPKGLIGMENLLNTCYFNAATQLLAHVPEVRDYYLSNQYLIDMAEYANNNFFNSNLDNEIEIAHAFADHIRSLYLGNDIIDALGHIHPRHLYDLAFSHYFFGNDNANKGKQEDASQFLFPFLNTLNESSNSIGTKLSVLGNLFYGTFHNVVKRRSDGYIKPQVEEHFNHISVGISTCRTIKECISHEHVAFERMKDEVYFEDTKAKAPADKQVTISSAPPYLFVQLKRFDIQRGNLVKVSKDVLYGLQLLVPVGKGDQLNEVLYDLIGITVHLGLAGAGHYISYVKMIDGDNVGKWFVFDDDKMPKEISTSTVRSQIQNGYIFLYKKKNV